MGGPEELQELEAGDPFRPPGARLEQGPGEVWIVVGEEIRVAHGAVLPEVCVKSGENGEVPVDVRLGKSGRATGPRVASVRFFLSQEAADLRERELRALERKNFYLLGSIPALPILGFLLFGHPGFSLLLLGLPILVYLALLHARTNRVREVLRIRRGREPGAFLLGGAHPDCLARLRELQAGSEE